MGTHTIPAEPADHPMKLKPNLTRWVIPGWGVQGGTTLSLDANKIHYIPIFVSETTTYTRIGIIVDTLSAGTADLRIFNWDNGVPGSLVLSAGTVDTGTTGNKEITISQELTRGYYFLAARFTGTPILKAPNAASASPPVLGFRTRQLESPNYVCLTVIAAYDDPAPAPTGGGGAVTAVVQLREN